MIHRVTAGVCAVTLLVALLLACTSPRSGRTGVGLAPGSTGDPPLIPHEVAQIDTGEDCLVCHGEEGMGAPVTPHPWLVDCQQCHIPLTEEGAGTFNPAVE